MHITLCLPSFTLCIDSQTAKAIHDCDLLRETMTVDFKKLTNKPECLTNMVITFSKDQQHFMTWELGTPGKRSNFKFSNRLSTAERCKPVTVHISIKVHYTGDGQKRTSTFVLNPNSCTYAHDVNFAEKCSGRKLKTSVTPTNPDQTDNSTAPAGFSGLTQLFYDFTSANNQPPLSILQM